MHSSAQPVLLLDETRLQHFDPTNQKDLFTMWSVFAKASEVMEHGKRLENMSWRLWNREALCRSSSAIQPRNCLELSRHSSSLPTTTRRTSDLTSSNELPTLSSSVESACSTASTAAEESEEHDAEHTSRQQQQLHPNRSVSFGSLVHSIKCQSIPKQPAAPLGTIHEQPESRPCTRTANSRTPRPSSPRNVIDKSSTSTVATTSDSFISAAGTSHTSAESASTNSDHSVVRGFAPGRLSSYTSKSQLAPSPVPILKTSAASRTSQTKTKKGMFEIGGGSSGDYDASLRDRMSPGSLTTQTISPETQKSSKKQTSFKDDIETIQSAASRQREGLHNDVFETDDEDEDEEEVSESAIDEDDDDAWEDDEEEVQEKPKQISFQRIDSTANLPLTSRKSQIALDLQRVKSTGNLSNIRSSPALRRSRTSTPNGPSMPASPDDDSPLEIRTRAARNQSQTLARPIITTSNVQDVPNPALSPRTTRRNMLAGELSESFRKQMIWERQQRNVYTTQGPMRRAHTTTDMRNLGNGEQDATRGESSGASRAKWNQYFDGGSTEYHAKGW